MLIQNGRYLAQSGLWSATVHESSELRARLQASVFRKNRSTRVENSVPIRSRH